MRAYLPWSIGTSIILLSLATLPFITQGSGLSQAALRFDSLKPNVSNSRILVVAQPTTSAAEARLDLNFAAGFTVGAAASLTTSTTSLPSTFQGQPISAWPISDSATSISGQNASFTSGDLSPGTLYAFWLTAGITTPPNIGSYVHVMTTKAGDGSTIDQSKLTTAIIADDQIELTTSVDPSYEYVTAAYDLDVTSTSSEGIVNPSNDYTYTITYSSNTKAKRDVTLQVEWTRGAIVGDPAGNRSFEVVSYVPGHTTNAFNGAAPVIDLDLRRIEWSIENFNQEDGEQTVSFRLHTADRSLSTQELEYRVHTSIIDSGTSGAEHEMGELWQPVPIATPTPISTLPPRATTPTPRPSSPPDTPPVATSTPTPTRPPFWTPTALFSIDKVEIVAISESSFTARVVLNQPGLVTLQYDSTLPPATPISSTDLKLEHFITVTGLAPDTVYYFTTKGEDADGNIVDPGDLYTLRTAKQALPSALETDKVLISAQGVILHYGVAPQSTQITLPVGTPIFVRIPFNGEVSPIDVDLRIHDPRVLGIRVPQPRNFYEYTPLLPTFGNNYSGDIITPDQPGIYTVQLSVRSSDGALYQDRLLLLRMVKPLRVVDSLLQPIESALVSLEKWQANSQLWQTFPAYSYGTASPLYSDAAGAIPVVLPAGRYRISAIAAAYQSQPITLDFDPAISTEYPTLLMQGPNFTLSSLIGYSAAVISDAFGFAHWNVLALTQSQRWAQLVITLSLMVSLGLLVMIARQLYRRDNTTDQHLLARLLWSIATGIGHFILIAILACLFIVGLSYTVQWQISAWLMFVLLATLWVCLTWLRWHNTEAP